MDVFDEARQVSAQERMREDAWRLVLTAIDRLTRADQVAILGRLANRLQPPAAEVAAAPLKPRPTQAAPSTPNGSAKRSAVPEGATALVRYVVSNADSPMVIMEIIEAVLRLRPTTDRAQIYSAVYKLLKSGRFIKTVDAYSVNPARSASLDLI